MNLNSGWTQLNAALKELRVDWEEATTKWDDAVRQNFEDQVWRPLENQVRSTLRGIERLTPALLKMQQECG